MCTRYLSDEENFMYLELNFGRIGKNLATNIKIFVMWTPDAWHKHCSQISAKKKLPFFDKCLFLSVL